MRSFEEIIDQPGDFLWGNKFARLYHISVLNMHKNS